MATRNLYIAAVLASMTGGLFGYSVGYIGGVLVLPSFTHHFGLDVLPATELAAQQSWLVSSWLIGCVIGVPTALPVCSRLGRKACLYFTAIFYIIGAVIQVLDIDGLGLFQLGRFVNGFGVGAGTLVGPVYISEVSPPAQRGALMSGYSTAIQILALVGFWGAYVSNAIFPDSSNLQWQIPVAIQLIPSAILLLGCLFILPESPRWLTVTGKGEAAEKSLSWLRMMDQDSAEVNAEAVEIKRIIDMNKRNEAAQPKSSFLSKVIRQPLRKRMLVGVGIMIAQNAVGLNALNYYVPIIFKTAGFTTVSASLFLTGIFGAVKLVTALLFMFVFVRIRGNRFWLLLGCGIMTVSMIVLSLCVRQAQLCGDDCGTTAAGIVAVLMVYVFAFAFGASLGPISWNICAEIFPSYINTQACTVTTCVQWLCQIVIASVTPPLIASIGWGTYLVYGTCCILSFIWCYFVVPETRGVPLGPPMDKVFGQTIKHPAVVIEDVNEDINETTPLIPATGTRRRSSVAFVV